MCIYLELARFEDLDVSHCVVTISQIDSRWNCKAEAVIESDGEVSQAVEDPGLVAGPVKEDALGLDAVEAVVLFVKERLQELGKPGELLERDLDSPHEAVYSGY